MIDSVLTAGRVAGLSMTVESVWDRLAPLSQQWDDLVLECGSHIYETYHWCRVWWDHYGAGRELAVFLFRRNDRLVGVIPMCIQRVRLGPVRLRLARPVGSDSTYTLWKAPVREDDAADAWRLLIRWLVETRGCDAIALGPSVEDNCGRGIKEACEALSDAVCVIRKTALGPETFFDLPSRFDEYMSSLPKRQRSNYRRDIHLLERSFSIEADSLSEPGVLADEFGRFTEMHDRQWQAEGRLGHFGDWPASEQFNRSLVGVHAALGRVRLLRLLANGEVASVQYCYRFGNRYYWRLSARACGSEWDRFGLGRVGLVKMIEQAIGEGVSQIEAGPAHYHYKVQLGGREYPMSSLLVASNQVLSLLRSRLFCRFADALNAVYYKTWYCRVVPRLPLPHRGLRKIWIRSRL